MRPLVCLVALLLGDYLLWNWSLNGNHDVLALVSGLTLPVLAIACAWRLAVLSARVLARGRRSPGRLLRALAARAARGGQRRTRRVRSRVPGSRTRRDGAAGGVPHAEPGAAGQRPGDASGRSSRRVAA